MQSVQGKEGIASVSPAPPPISLISLLSLSLSLPLKQQTLLPATKADSAPIALASD